MNRIATTGFIALTVAFAPVVQAQYTADFQTNIISGVTSNWSGDYVVGSNTFADVLLIENSGVLSNGIGYLGYELGASNNTVIVNNGVWNNASTALFGNMVIGNYGAKNSLIISNGATVLGSYRYLGFNASASNNSVVVTGLGSSWSGQDIYFYRSAGNRLVICDQAVVYARYCSVGYIADGNSVLVTGSGSLWTNRSVLAIGESGGSGNSLVISNQGRVVNTDGYIGETSGSNNSVMVSGPGSVWSNADLYVGFGGMGGSLVISNQATVFADTGYIGVALRSSNNTARVVNGGVWRNNSSLFVGNQGRNNSLLVDGGSVFATGLIIGSSSTPCDNVVQLDSGSVIVTNATTDAVFEVRRGMFILNGGTIQVNQFVMTDACAQFIRTGGTLIYDSAVLTTNLDADGDGMANGWEQAYGLDPLNAADANADNDGDGQSNLQEFLAGTDPTNSASAFRILNVVATNDDMLVTWTAGGGRSNVVQSASDVAGSYTNISPNIIVTGSGDVTTNYLDTGSATNGLSRFYKIRLVP